MATARLAGRCDQCGYSLIGLALEGVCPECGRLYTNLSAGRLKPWPGALEVCVRLGWPLVGLMMAAAMTMSRNDGGVLLGIIGIWAMIVALPINSYFNVRWLLKRSLPDQTRTRGPVAIMRAIGTTLCVLVLLIFVGGPLVLGVGCLILLSRN